MRTSSILMNGGATLLGSGLNHRHLSQDQRAALAASIVSGERPFIPSGEHACVIFGIPRPVLTKALKARRKNGASNGNGNGNGANPSVAALKADAEDELVTSPEKLVEVFSQVASRLGIAKALDVLASIERANSEI